MIDLRTGVGVRSVGVSIANASPERTLGKPSKGFSWIRILLLATAAFAIADLWARWAIKVML